MPKEVKGLATLDSRLSDAHAPFPVRLSAHSTDPWYNPEGTRGVYPHFISNSMALMAFTYLDLLLKLVSSRRHIHFFLFISLLILYCSISYVVHKVFWSELWLSQTHFLAAAELWAPPWPSLPAPSSLKNASSIRPSFSCIIFSAYFFELSMMKPPIIISSKIKYAWWKLNMRSNSHTLLKYLSNTSTKWWMMSNTINSLSSFSMHATKYSDAYLTSNMHWLVNTNCTSHTN